MDGGLAVVIVPPLIVIKERPLPRGYRLGKDAARDERMAKPLALLMVRLRAKALRPSFDANAPNRAPSSTTPAAALSGALPLTASGPPVAEALERPSPPHRLPPPAAKVIALKHARPKCGR